MATLIPQQRMDRLRRLRPAALSAYLDKHGDTLVLIYSKQHGSYWCAGGAGYTDALNAGVYSLREAWQRTSHCGPEKGINYVISHWLRFATHNPTAPCPCA